MAAVHQRILLQKDVDADAAQRADTANARRQKASTSETVQQEADRRSQKKRSCNGTAAASQRKKKKSDAGGQAHGRAEGTAARGLAADLRTSLAAQGVGKDTEFL